MAARGRQQQLSPEEKYQRAISARRKFRALVKLIMANLAWLQEVEDDKLGDNVKKNIQVLTRKKGKKSMLTLQDKTLLNKPAFLRTDEEKAHLRKLLGGLKCFRKYPSAVKDELPCILYFNFFGPNRIILKQGYEPLNLYIILTGEVVVSQAYYDRLLQKEVSKDVLVMGPGNIFGEVALLHDIERTATVTTSEASEFLYIRRDDFDRVLRETVAGQWAEIKHNLSWFSYFKDWDAYNIREACIVARKKYFKPDQIILSSSGGQFDCVYFVTKGYCYLMEHITVKTVYKNGLPSYHLVKEPGEEDDRSPTVVYKDIKKLYKRSESRVDLTQLRYSLRPAISVSRSTVRSSSVMPRTQMHFINVCTFKKLACFNVGESMKNRVVVAGTNTECLLLPRYFLLDKCMLTVRTIKDFLTLHIPTDEKIFKNFLEDKKWSSYKQRLVGDILSEKKLVTGNNIHNVPYTIRLQEDLGDI